MNERAVSEFHLPEYLRLVASGKVRQIYELTSSELMFVTTDKISAYDVVMSNAIDQKGSVLTQLSEFWFRHLQATLPELQTHFISIGVPEVMKGRLLSFIGKDILNQLETRTMVVKRVEVLPIESIVRGYVTGSLWSSYQLSGAFCGIALPPGLKESERLEKPLWTPSTKAEPGQHDENISPEQAAKIVGPERARQIEELSLKLYISASTYAAERGIIIADTKFEFGLDHSTEPPTLTLVDEVLTPDSSRFWDRAKYEVGRCQSSFDKQHLRDWLTSNSLKGNSNVTIPEGIVAETAKRYKQAFEILTGRKWVDK